MSQGILNNLFTPLTRDQRQDEAIKKWIESGGKGTIVAATAFGKTRTAIKIIQKLRVKYPNMLVLVVVPTDLLKKQWHTELLNWNLDYKTDVKVMMGASKKKLECDLLIIDESHRINSECISSIFENTKFKLILGLTATFERLDGRHEILAKYAPVCDTITLHDALLNGWISRYKDYVVLLDVADIDIIPEMVEYFTQLPKKDCDHSRLKQYKVLEKKKEFRVVSGSNEEFLNRSCIQVEILHDC